MNSSHCGDKFVLLTWACRVLLSALDASPSFARSSQWHSVIATLSILFDSVCGTASRRSLSRSANANVWRVFRKHKAVVPGTVASLLEISKTSMFPARFVPLIGSAIDILCRSKPSKNSELPNTWISKLKPDIITYHTQVILMSRSILPSHAKDALNEFVSHAITATDLGLVYLPTIEKALLRSPEISISVANAILSSYSGEWSDTILKRLQASIAGCAKSGNGIVRSGAVEMAKIILNSQPQTHPIHSFFASELLTLPKHGKTASAEHRATLYAILGHIKPSASVSAELVNTVPSLLSKEINETAAAFLRISLATHLTHCMIWGTGLLPDASSVIVKECASSKMLQRRSFLLAVAECFWLLGDKLEKEPKFSVPEPTLKFGAALLPILESNLKATVASPMNTTIGPIEGYIALAVVLRRGSPLSAGSQCNLSLRSDAYDGVGTSRILQILGLGGSKTSFLLSDKVYGKLSAAADEIWGLRSLSTTILQIQDDLETSANLRLLCGQELLHHTVFSKDSETRKLGIAIIGELNHRAPELVHRMIREALIEQFQRPFAAADDSITQSSTYLKMGYFSAVLLALVDFNPTYSVDMRQDRLAELFVISHHHLLTTTTRALWIEAIQASGVDPKGLVVKKREALISAVVEAASVPYLSNAAFDAAATIAFIAPDSIISQLAEQINKDLNPESLLGIGEFELGVWSTPEGSTFIDVLNAKKRVTTAKGKNHEIEKWEEEVKKAIAAKKANTMPSLSREDRKLVEEQLQKEAEVRLRVATIKAEAERGLGLLQSLLRARTEDLQPLVWPMCKLLLDGALLSPLSLSAAFDVYLAIGSSCSRNLGIYRTLTGISCLRSFSVSAVPKGFLEEPLAELTLRVLYHMHSVSSDSPLNAFDFAYLFPLLLCVLEHGGVGQPEEEAGAEQITLALEIIERHIVELADPTYPRYETLELLLNSIARYPKVSNTTASCLVILSHGLNQSATEAETQLLLQGTLAQESFVRSACLQALQPFDLTDKDWCPEIWVACHDDDQPNARLAYDIWEDNGMDVKNPYGADLLPLLGSGKGYVRASASRAIASAASHFPSSVPSLLADLKSSYRDMAKILAPEFDAYGMLIERSLEQSDPWPTREAISWTFEQLAQVLPSDELLPFFEFLIREEALGDRHASVRRRMLEAGVAVIDMRGQEKLQELLAEFENQLPATYSSTEIADWVREALVILLGRLAQHLDMGDPRRQSIVARLIDALRTPSELVQAAVAECLSPLAAPLQDKASLLMDELFQTLTTASKYAERRGAAYGLGGILKGWGVVGFKEFRVMASLRSALGNKKNFEARQGALFAIETMSALLGRLFEPYVMEILPLLLAAYGDTTVDVREAAQDASKVIMANLSGYGVKSVLPSLLETLEEKQWRTKKGAIELLGSMAFLAPRQLSISLPIVIPRLTGVLTDSHTQVKTAANSSLKRFGEVITNPEVRSIVPTLLKALVDPEKTSTALNALLKKSFVHYIDSASLALLIPILERGMRERGSETKRKAAQIVGNMASLTDSKDFIPYLPRLVPLVHTVLTDPVPESRATAAKALGTLIERLGEVSFPDMVSNLLHTLKTDTSAVDRQGAAQGLSEVLSGLGVERMEGLLPEIVTNARSARSHVREGFMSLLVFLPTTFGHRFSPHLSRIIPPILNGLADGEEFVRTASMKAGRMIINNYSNKAIDLLLPELERGMFDSSWRIRHSSVALVGETLYKISGISRKTEIEEDGEADVVVAEGSRKALADVLGKDRRDRILGSLYIVRQDPVHACRQAAIHIWKALVHNTPRTVREILPCLMEQIVVLLANQGDEQRETAARTLGELCRKQGERILSDTVPILRAGAESSDSKTREGVCFAISEVLENTTKGQRENHEDELISAVRISLVDNSASVRIAAAQAFDSLQEHVGSRAIDQTIPTLLEALRSPGAASDTALQALREIMTVRASTVFPVLIPTLITQPISAFNADALAVLVTVAGSALTQRLTQVLGALVAAAENETDEKTKDAVEAAIVSLVGSVEDLEGLHSLMMTLLSWAKHENPRRRVSGALTFAKFCENTSLDFSEYRADWIRQLVSLMDDHEIPVHEAAWQAFDEFIKSVDKTEMELLVVTLRRTIEGTGAPGRVVPGFSYSKGVGPMLPVIFAGLTTGSNEQREQAALAIADLVERTDDAALRPYTTQITGPLIRVITQASALPAGVKSAILIALAKMLERIPIFIKPFFPQLQRTFVKSLTDASLAVRSRAVAALTVLMRNQPRADPLIAELIGSIRSSGEDGIAGSLASALAGVVDSAWINISPTSLENLRELVIDSYRDPHDEPYYIGIAELFAALSRDAALVRPALE
ncbi:armadillo-type protein [Cantharellus anzutake]|uniref:armadillo-type protein n=1 Tax=Cantharellus anzutake TaxID=1750568 RepID=UPI001905BE4B|nr:armadillo-type protein [Cantharellus anzutake]KAF8343178.1 armadillo-type protein [Cantharellus anzutake]